MAELREWHTGVIDSVPKRRGVETGYDAKPGDRVRLGVQSRVARPFEVVMVEGPQVVARLTHPDGSTSLYLLFRDDLRPVD